MQSLEAEIRSQKQVALDALRRGDPLTARKQFEQIAAAGHGDALVWLALAAACKALGDKDSTIAAVDNVLGLEPRNPRALVMKADHFAAAGDVPSALAFYRAAIKAATTAGQLPPDLAREIARAEQACVKFAREYESFLRGRLGEQGFDETTSSSRFALSIDLLHGKKQLYTQQPRHYYFPELPQKQFYDRADFPWLDAIEAMTADIRAECETVMRDDTAFAPYVTRGQKERPAGDGFGMLDNPNWSAFFLWRDGAVVPENAARCPKTIKALERAPLTSVKGRMPSALFSLLRPGTRIPPHTGVVNTRLICHLPLIVPGQCEFRVGNDTREWQEGKAWVFDDSVEHEAWNNSDRTRVVLLFDIWRPELSADERKLVAAMLEAIDSYGGANTKWVD